MLAQPGMPRMPRMPGMEDCEAEAVKWDSGPQHAFPNQGMRHLGD